MGQRLSGWNRLSWRDRVRLAHLSIGLAPIHGLLAFMGFARTQDWIERMSERPVRRRPTPLELKAAGDLADLASIAGRHGLFDASCLRQSLLLYFTLRRRGLEPKLKIGVRRQSSQFDAHAWVELDGIALGQTALAHTPMIGSDARERPQ